jgi:hypothetical protein
MSGYGMKANVEAANEAVAKFDSKPDDAKIASAFHKIGDHRASAFN